MNILPTSKTVVGKAVRLPLRLVRPDWQIPVLSGGARGLRWIAGSGNAGHWLGTFDSRTGRVLQREVVTGSVVYEIGAFVGYYSLQASVLVGPNGRVIAFEPSACSLRFLHEHLLINHITNVTVVEVAVGERSGTTPFHVDSENPCLSRPCDHGDSDGDGRVPMISLDDFIEREGIPLPSLIKVDVVGSEMAVLRGAVRVLTNHHPPLILRIHSFDLNPPWTGFLRDLGYDVVPFEHEDFRAPGGVLARHAGHARSSSGER